MQGGDRVNVNFDASELNTLAADLTAGTMRSQLAAVGIVKKGAHNIAEQARQLAGGIRHAPMYPASITYDIVGSGARTEALIGPDKNKPQGALGNILEYGTSKNAPLAHLGPALDVEGPKFVAAIELAAGQVLRG